MRKLHPFLLMLFIAVSILLSSCSWKPSVSPVAVTEPWQQLQLPVAENAVVWGSTPTEFKAVHKSSDKKEVADDYKAALENKGWQMTKFEPGDIEYMYFKSPDGATYELESYDFEKTGIIIRKK